MYVFIFGLLLSQASEETEGPRGIQARMAATKNITVEYEFSQEYKPYFGAAPKVDAAPVDDKKKSPKLPMQDQRGIIIVPITGIYTGEGEFRFGEGAASFDFTKNKDGKSTRTIRTYLGDRAEWFEQVPRREGMPQYRGFIRDVAGENLPSDAVIDYALGLRLFYSKEWLTAKTLRIKPSVGNDKNSYQRYRIMNTSSQLSWHIWTVDPSHSYRLVKYEIIEALDEKSLRKGEGHMAMELTNREFANTDGVDLPMEIHCQTISKGDDGSFHNTQEMTIKVKKYHVRGVTNTPESMRIVWPKDFDPLDNRSIGSTVRRGFSHLLGRGSK